MLKTLVALCSLFAAVSTHAATPDTLNVPAGELVSALKSLATQSNIELVYQPELLKGIRTRGVKGAYSPREAVAILLEGTQLRVYTASSGAMVIAPAAANPMSQAEIDSNAGGSVARQSKTIELARATPAEVDPPASKSGDAAGEGAEIQEVIVTAQKRAERLQDVPVPVTAISAQELVDSSQLRLQDYYNKIPGLNFTSRTQSAQILSIRSIGTGGIGSPTVGVLIDEVPYGSTVGLDVPDIDPGDLARVEVLRGPQGTLYGASSMGGLLKFVTVDPSTDQFSGRVQTGVSTVTDSDELGFNVRGSVNVPLSDTWAIRASAFSRKDAGYIDDPGLGAEDVNSIDAQGGRVSALWQVSDDFSLRLSALFQTIEGDGSSESHSLAGLGDLEQRNTLRNQGVYDRKAQAYSATIKANVAGVDLTIASGYGINESHDVFDISYLLGGTAQTNFGVGGASSITDFETKKFTQEVRALMPVGQRFELLVGGFYTDEDRLSLQDIPAVNPATGAVVSTNSILRSATPSTYQEYAAFADLTFRVTDRFDVQVGGRHSWIDQTTEPGTSSGVLAGNPVTPIVTAKLTTEENTSTYLLTPRFKFSPELMMYARFASGYRPGGANGPAGACTTNNFTCAYSADETQTYEFGLKGSTLGGTLTFDASLYHIGWTDIQAQQSQGLFNFVANGGEAKSQGVELTVELQPWTGMTVVAWTAYNIAELSEDFPSNSTALGLNGAELPFSSRWSANLSVDQDFPLTDSLIGFLGASVSYMDERIGIFRPRTAPARQVYPSITTTDLRAGLRYQDWTANVFVNNVADKRGLLSGGLGGSPPYGFTYTQPRTVGVSLSRTF